MNTVAIITTYNREPDFWKLYDSISKNKIDIIVIQDDGVNNAYSERFYYVMDNSRIKHHIFEENVGIGVVKQKGVDMALEEGYAHIYIVEDDIVIKDNKVWDYGISWSNFTGLAHFNWNSCLENKLDKVYEYPDGFNVRVNENASGNFSYFGCDALDGFEFDDAYFNALEHVDLEYQLCEVGMQPPFWAFCSPDKLDDYLETPNCSNSTIVGRPDQKENVLRAYRHWNEKWKQTLSGIPRPTLAKVERSLAKIREEYGVDNFAFSEKRGVSIICTIKNRCIIKYKSTDDILPQEIQQMSNHDRLIRSVEGSNKDKGGVRLNQDYMNDPEGFRPFDAFLESINKQADFFDGDVELVVVDWESTDDDVESIVKHHWKHPYKVVKLSGEEKFSRGYALDVGAKQATHDVIHFTDIDMTYHSPRFLEDASTIASGAIFPMIYKEQSPSGLTLYLEIAGFGISTMSKETYLKSGGYPDIRKWGGEDNELFDKVEKLVGSGNVKRTVYHECVHKWHSNALR